MNLGKDFKNYATKHVGLNTINTENVINNQVLSLTPYILEERALNVSFHVS